MYSVIFGLDLIGNPSKLFNNFETGIKDLIDESKRGFESSSAGSGIVGVAKGLRDLLGHVVGVSFPLVIRSII